MKLFNFKREKYVTDVQNIDSKKFLLKTKILANFINILTKNFYF